MSHLGDITKINGSEIEPVDIITFGSPCQNLSVAGDKTGLQGEESSLFTEAIRIIYEMRDMTNGQYPRFAVWENVPGAFSSNGGDDFRVVLSKITQTDIPMSKHRKWAKSGLVRTKNCGVSWRTLDSQFWGVPQRRKRIFLIADFRENPRPEVLFEQESLSGHFAASRKEREENPGIAGRSPNSTSILNNKIAFFNGRASSNRALAYSENISPTLRSGLITNVLCIENHPQDGRVKVCEENTVQTLSRKMGTGGGNVPLICHTEVATKGVRRLTPLECERLQGFPDDWTKYGADGEVISDTQRYMAIGNSVALPCVEFVMQQIHNELKNR